MCIPERTSRCPEGGIETRTGWRGCSNNTKWEGVCTCDHTGPRVSITRASFWALHIQHLETLKGMNYCPPPHFTLHFPLSPEGAGGWLTPRCSWCSISPAAAVLRSLTWTLPASPQLHRPFSRQHHHPVGPHAAPVPVLPQQTPHLPVAVWAPPGDPVQQQCPGQHR